MGMFEGPNTSEEGLEDMMNLRGGDSSTSQGPAGKGFAFNLILCADFFLFIGTTAVHLSSITSCNPSSSHLHTHEDNEVPKS